MQVTDKQRKLIWAGAIIFSLYYVAPWGINAIRSVLSDPPPVQAKPTPAHIAPPAPKPIVLSPEEAVNAQAVKMQGDWIGSGVLNGGPCRLSIQIHPDPLKPGGYSAYSTTACKPTFMTFGQDRQKAMETMLKGITPTSVILSGEPRKGELVFKVDKTIGVPLDGCVWTGLTVSPFGELIAAEWQAAPCKGGQMTLRRVTNVQ